MERIRGLVAGSSLVEKMLAAAFGAMADEVKQHASEFLPGGICAKESITPELRQRLAGCPITSIGAERVFAIGRMHDKRAGASRDDSRADVILGNLDDTCGFMRGRDNAEE